MDLHPRHLSLVAAAPGLRAPADVPVLAPDEDAPTADGIPAVPPPEVAAQVAAACRRAGDLHAAGRELHFATDPGSGRLVVEVRDLRGRVLRRIAPSEALAIMAGDAPA